MRLWSNARATRRNVTHGSGYDSASPITDTPTMLSSRSNAASTSSGRSVPISAEKSRQFMPSPRVARSSRKRCRPSERSPVRSQSAAKYRHTAAVSAREVEARIRHSASTCCGSEASASSPSTPGGRPRSCHASHASVGTSSTSTQPSAPPLPISAGVSEARRRACSIGITSDLRYRTQQRARVLVRRVEQHLFHRALFHDLPLMHHCDPVGDLPRQPEVVCDDQ